MDVLLAYVFQTTELLSHVILFGDISLFLLLFFIAALGIVYVFHRFHSQSYCRVKHEKQI